MKSHSPAKAISFIAIFFMILGFQNCNGVAFNPTGSTAVAASSNNGPGGPIGNPPGGGGGGGGGTPSCTPSPTDTPAITTLPSGVTAAQIAAICPAVQHDSECGVVIIISNSGESLYFTGQGPYDGRDDTMVGVLNMSSSVVNSIDLSSQLDIMGFDNDGIGLSAVVGSNNMDTTGYGGPNAYYTNITNNNDAGTVNFLTPVAANGGTTYFGLENALTATSACLATSPH